jgi:hypothetical protein
MNFSTRNTLASPAFIAALALLGFFALPQVAQAQQVVAPNSLAGVEGNAENRFPFLVDGGLRLQQVFNASQFSAISGPTQITQIAFRPDSSLGAAFSRTLSNVTIQLSTTSAAADGLSLTFASNIGADVTTVRSGSLTLSSSFTGVGPKDFDILINLTTPFTYNPASGNLLMDVLNQSPENNNISLFFDAPNTTGDSSSRIYGTEGAPGATAGTSDSSGMVTRFTFGNASVAAPEPGTLALLALGIVGRVLAKRRK